MKDEFEDGKQQDLERVSVKSDGESVALTKREIQGWYAPAFSYSLCATLPPFPLTLLLLLLLAAPSCLPLRSLPSFLLLN